MNKEIDKVINKTILLLNDNIEWIDRYSKYYKNIISNTNYKKSRRQFHTSKYLSIYSSVSKINNKSCEFDIRLKGQSIGTINVDQSNVVKISTIEKKDNNIKYFNINKTLNNSDWKGKDAKEFRKQVVNYIERDNSIKTHSKEHEIENILLKEFNKRKRQTKGLCNIQPITLNNCYFQMPTPISASQREIKYNSKGGGIDILARVKHKNGESRLCVMELKDQYIKSEPYAKVIKQATAYATFIGTLLYEKSNYGWWDIFGLKLNSRIIIDVVAVMPLSELHKPSIEGTTIKNNNFSLELHSLFFDDNNNFSGTLKDSLLQ